MTKKKHIRDLKISGGIVLGEVVNGGMVLGGSTVERIATETC